MLGSSLQAKVIIQASEIVLKKLEDINLPEVLICSDVEMNLNENMNNSDDYSREE